MKPLSVQKICVLYIQIYRSHLEKNGILCKAAACLDMLLSMTPQVLSMMGVACWGWSRLAGVDGLVDGLVDVVVGGFCLDGRRRGVCNGESRGR